MVWGYCSILAVCVQCRRAERRHPMLLAWALNHRESPKKVSNKFRWPLFFGERVFQFSKINLESHQTSGVKTAVLYAKLGLEGGTWVVRARSLSAKVSYVALVFDKRHARILWEPRSRFHLPLIFFKPTTNVNNSTNNGNLGIGCTRKPLS